MTERRVLSAADILSAPDFKLSPVDMPEWGGTVHVRSLSLKGLIGFQRIAGDAAAGKVSAEDIAQLVAASACNPDGSPLFTAEEAAQLVNRDGKAMQRLFSAAVAAIGATVEGVAEEKKD